MSSRIFNPAAVFGHSFALVKVGGTTVNGKDAHLYATTAQKISGVLSGSFTCRDDDLLNAVKALPCANLMVQATVGDYLYFEKMPYAQLLDVLVAMAAFGVVGKDLLAEQVQVHAQGGHPGYQQATTEFEGRALTFLDGLRSGRLIPCLGASLTKPAKVVNGPTRGVLLTGDKRQLHVYPDPFDARYATIMQLGTAWQYSELAGVRNAAFEYFEPLGLRPWLRSPT
ncbi:MULTISPECIES: hypothetical protein [unclassified Variovorax]|nr:MULTISPECIES: hypothetical protein [unclassified Variovorax]PNG50440.1 hypothetical protein CHC06_06064 [Variovorax sp. B2]PNG51313.1 hypothetical protein CHC07_05970 [Variovorax sp. B4]VTU43290.1 hypothetical protein H6P1_00410 [Variovorax sp. PBL-H6]VTU43308.1 hypothetical protein SRS16P1_00495 [Variovorax sp. SRS16]VTU43330.1 hypothetical protein E5P1_00492 [Variovorax sp. PBL-E5]